MTATEQISHGRSPRRSLTELVRDLADRIEALEADVRRLGGRGGRAPSRAGWARRTAD